VGGCFAAQRIHFVALEHHHHDHSSIAVALIVKRVSSQSALQLH
jgi:hypothetical protein